MRRHAALFTAGLVTLLAGAQAEAQPEPQTILQYFETDWSEITRRMPEIARAGYTAIWLPPPTKGAEGTADVGFAVYDRFDLGDQNQRGTVATRYGTKDDVVQLVREAHRFGIRVYFDTVMNHNSNPAKIENAGVNLNPVGIDEFPGTSPLDFHVLPARDVGSGNWEVQRPSLLGGGLTTLSPAAAEGESFVPVVPFGSGPSVAGFTHWARTPRIDFDNLGPNDEIYLSLVGLIDFAIEQFADANGPLPADGTNPIAGQPLPRFVRDPSRPETYPGQTPVEEDIREYMMRWVRWLGEETDCDGLRIDAIKHVGTSFFGSDFNGDPIDFNGTFQRNYDDRRGYTDGNDDDGAQDALLFGEAFTSDTGLLGRYRATGMYALDFPLFFKLSGIFGASGDRDLGQLSFPQGGMGAPYEEFGGLGREAGVSFVQSHDSYAPGAQPNAAHAFTLSRVGHSVVFYDGNHYDSNSFVIPGREDALGELGSSRILDLVDLRRRFARGGMFNRWVGSDAYVFERVVPTPNGAFGSTMLVAITDRTSGEVKFGEFDEFSLVVTEFPPGTVLEELTGNGAYPEVTVLDPSAVAQGARDFALSEYDRSSDFPTPGSYGLVYLQIPAGPSDGYVVYAPKTPAATLTLESSGIALPTTDIETVGARQTSSGATVSPSVIRASSHRSASPVTLVLQSDLLADRALVRIDNPDVGLPGLTRVTGSEGGLHDGFFELPSSGANRFSADLVLDAVPDGIHLITVRVLTAGTPSFYTEAHAYLQLEAGGLPPDAGVPDSGSANDSGVPTGPDGGELDGGPPDSGVDPGQRDRDLDAIVEAIVTETFDPTLDQNSDGVIDVSDFVLRRSGS